MATESNIFLRCFRSQLSTLLNLDLCFHSLARQNLACARMARRALRAVIMGPPGAGKWTISARISSTFNLTHISSGDLLRTHISQGTELGREAQCYISEGQLVPDSTVVSLILQTIAESGQHRWLLDGFPRTIHQADALTKHTALDTVINLNVPAATIIDRVRGRWVHIPSGRVYHDEYNPPKVARLDDHTGEELIQRSDDHPATVRERLEQYEAQTRPLLDYYKQQNILQTFSGIESDAIWPQIKNYFHNTFHTS